MDRRCGGIAGVYESTKSLQKRGATTVPNRAVDVVPDLLTLLTSLANQRGAKVALCDTKRSCTYRRK